MSGKGSTPRPFSVDQDKFASNWERIFGKKEDKQEKKFEPGLCLDTGEFIPADELNKREQS